MTRSCPTCRWQAYLFAGVLLVVGVGGAVAQGTEAERDACTPDALRLCSDAVPDIPKTTACMKAHQAELSARCRPFVVGRAEPTRRERSRALARRIERDEPPAVDRREWDQSSPVARRFEREAPPPEGVDAYPDDRRYLYRTPDGREAESPEGFDRARARNEIGRLCDEDMIDPRTCAITDRALR